MAVTQLEIFNMALGFLGTRMITADELGSPNANPVVPPKSPEAKQCLLFWDRARRTTLLDAIFPFSVGRATLDTHAVPTVYTGAWDYGYSLGTFLKVLSVHDGAVEEREPFAYESGVVLCNVAPATAQFSLVKDVTDLTAWDELFIQSVSLRLALFISTALLKNNSQKIQELKALYDASLPVDRWREEKWVSGGEVTKLHIYNMALSLVGAKGVGSTTENCPEAVQCSVHWDNARRATLRDFPFNFALRRFELEEVEMPDVYADEWRYCYAAPDDILRVHKVHVGSNSRVRIPFAMENTEDGPVILCNTENAQATCVLDVTDSSLWDETFVTAMSRKLAIMICASLYSDPTSKNASRYGTVYYRIKQLEELYAESLPYARGADANEKLDFLEEDAWLLARGAGFYGG